MKTDAELLLSYADTRSEADFAGFVGRRVGFVYRAALRQTGGDAQAAEDVAQAVFTLAACRAASLAQHAQLSGWLYTTTTHLARRAWRDARRRTGREQEAARMNEIENEGASANENANTARARDRGPDELRPLLDEALGALREGERDAVLLRFFEGRGFAEIGAALKMSEDAARMRVTRAVEKICAAFAKRGVTSSASALAALMTAEAAQAAPAGLAASVSAGAIATASAAAAVSGASTTGALLAFMSSSKITTVAVVTLLVAAGGAYYGAQNERESAASLAQARQENTRLEAQLRDEEQQNAKAGAAAAKRDQEAAGQAFLADYPEVKEKGVAWGISIGAQAFFRIAHEMNLLPEQRARLAEIMRRTPFTSTHDIPGYGTATFTIGGDPELRSKRKEQELRDLLGDDGYEKYNELNALNNTDADFNIRRLGSALYFTDAPLTSRQAWRLDKIVGDLKKNHAGITDPQVRWNALVEQAKPVLSPEQMRALTEAGDRYIWKSISDKWTREYDDARTIITSTYWSELLK